MSFDGLNSIIVSLLEGRAANKYESWVQVTILYDLSILTKLRIGSIFASTDD